MMAVTLTEEEKDFRSSYKSINFKSFKFTPLARHSDEVVSLYLDDKKLTLFIFCKRFIYIYSSFELIHKVDIKDEPVLANKNDYNFVYSYAESHYLYFESSGLVLFKANVINNKVTYSFNDRFKGIGNTFLTQGPIDCLMTSYKNGIYFSGDRYKIIKLELNLALELKNITDGSLVYFEFLTKPNIKDSLPSLICLVQSKLGYLYVEHSICIETSKTVTISKKIISNKCNYNHNEFYVKKITEQIIVLFLNGKLYKVTGSDCQLIWENSTLKSNMIANIIPEERNQQDKTFCWLIYTMDGTIHKLHTKNATDSKKLTVSYKLMETNIKSVIENDDLKFLFTLKFNQQLLVTSMYKVILCSVKKNYYKVEKKLKKIFHRAPLFTDCISYNKQGFEINSLIISGSHGEGTGFIEKRYPSAQTAFDLIDQWNVPDDCGIIKDFWVTKKSIFYDSLNCYYEGSSRHSKENKSIINVSDDNTIIFDSHLLNSETDKSKILFYCQVKYSVSKLFLLLKSSRNIEVCEVSSQCTKTIDQFELTYLKEEIICDLKSLVYNNELLIIAASSKTLTIYSNSRLLNSIRINNRESIFHIEVILTTNKDHSEQVFNTVTSLIGGTVRVYNHDLSTVVMELKAVSTESLQILAFSDNSPLVIVYNKFEVFLMDLQNLTYGSIVFNINTSIFKIRETNKSLFLLSSDDIVYHYITNSNWKHRPSMNLELQSHMLETKLDIPIKIIRTNMEERFIIVSDEKSSKVKRLHLLNSGNMSFIDSFKIGKHNLNSISSNFVSNHNHSLSDEENNSTNLLFTVTVTEQKSLLYVLRIHSQEITKVQTIKLTLKVMTIKYLLNENLLVVVCDEDNQLVIIFFKQNFLDNNDLKFNEFERKYIPLKLKENIKAIFTKNRLILMNATEEFNAIDITVNKNFEHKLTIKWKIQDMTSLLKNIISDRRQSLEIDKDSIEHLHIKFPSDLGNKTNISKLSPTHWQSDFEFINITYFPKLSYILCFDRVGALQLLEYFRFHEDIITASPLDKSFTLINSIFLKHRAYFKEPNLLYFWFVKVIYI
ncbi:hypothetical protein TPHA_0O00340 [Tetrapisispora phaffii CBS 4417]|uniref:Uncharacterized protein n=1 Tax=Tetrapisispora phaffii (strain ATCC 24235 / CBS 4417 / NBRC 1672 / NRRL Y-8282 / UCD 70-5) TaxID=1071381 RepID=G8C1H7_TETPH|nr:hypothetical protein TPHA_0O00340 [Tetrapisispora phaffii CBS 4417]CCE66005.1 hypothetical protein TPHA_0O00340 [Tetrapisispora phaffii CBS 4417]